MVTGGYRSGFFDSTEIFNFNDNVWRIVSGKLPVKMYFMSAVTINNRVLAFGKLFLIK